MKILNLPEPTDDEPEMPTSIEDILFSPDEE